MDVSRRRQRHSRSYSLGQLARIGLDSRLAFAVPIYGCGYLFESGNNYQQCYEKMTPAQADLCRRLWDAISYLKNAKMPILWLNGTNDAHFSVMPF